MEGHATQNEAAGLRALSHEAVPGALKKAMHYRLLKEPELAESICLDIVEIEPTNQDAWIQLLLSRTDQLEARGTKALQRAREVLPHLEGQYAKAYYGGLICERHAKTLLTHRARRSGMAAWEWFQQALAHYDRAIELSPAGDDEAVLRWNTCVRLIKRHSHCRPDTRPADQLGIE